MPRDLRSFALEFNLDQLIKDHTRISAHSRTIIDLLFVNCSHKVVQAGVMYPLISDHSLIFCVIKGGVNEHHLSNLNIVALRIITRLLL